MKRALPYLLAGLVLLLRDGGVAPAAVAAAGCALAALTWVLDEGLGRAARSVLARPRVQRVAGGLAWLVWAGLPCLFALDAYRRAGDELSLLTPAMALAATAALIGASWLAERFGSWTGASRAAMLVVGLPELAIFAWLVDASGVLLSVRPGTELDHLALFAGAWSLALFASAVDGHGAAGAGEAPKPPPTWLGAVCLVLGLVVLEADQRALIDEYPAIHLWMALQGFVLVRIGAEGLIGERLDGRPLVGRVALGLLGAAALFAAIHLPSYSKIHARGSLERSAIGRSLLVVIPASRSEREAGGAAMPELAYPRFLDEPSPLDRPNVLLVTVDALRDDIYPHAPALEAFAARSLRFDHAYAQGSRTAIGMGTLLSGRYSANIDWELWVYKKGNIFPRSQLTAAQIKKWKRKYVHTTIPIVPQGDMLAERLEARGYTTVAVPYAGHNQFFRDGVGFERGFDVFVDLTKSKWKAPTSARISERVLAELAKIEGKDEPWFLWAHYYDPHESRGKRDRYEELIGEFDSAFAELVAHLERSGRLDDTVVAIVADHGEALGEHGHRSHATSVYDEQIRVPLILWVPGVGAGRFDSPVAAIDLTATLAVLAGADTERLDGTNLLPMTRGVPEALVDRPVFSELHRYMSSKGERTSDLKSVRLGRWKLIHNRKRGTITLYDVLDDPDEDRDRMADEPEVGERLLAILDAFLASAEAEHPLP